MPETKVTTRNAREQIGRREYYEARRNGLIAIHVPAKGPPYHYQYQIDEYIIRRDAANLRPAVINQAVRRGRKSLAEKLAKAEPKLYSR